MSDADVYSHDGNKLLDTDTDASAVCIVFYCLSFVFLFDAADSALRTLLVIGNVR